ncbi:Hypothetical protein, putative [Bodo saltans]|uniref:GATOR2 complex protein MIO zinc-ribbon like domain-containing protein n=1 Tax=Bodo saltans TaxID=75058 RepID=A0A0S4J7Z9_BODSA|nr:Hypothetical protein, putative [Bodo saltans]|eukprot:CUG87530.1 Hypothetical protein, putative [Bodo saltans]
MSCKFFLSVPETRGTFVAFTRGSVTVIEVVTTRSPTTTREEVVTPSQQHQRTPVAAPLHLSGSFSSFPRVATASSFLPFGAAAAATTAAVVAPHYEDGTSGGDPSWRFPAQPLAGSGVVAAAGGSTHTLQRFASLDSLLQFPKSPQLQPLIAHHHHRVLSHEDQRTAASTFQDFEEGDYDDMVLQLNAQSQGTHSDHVTGTHRDATSLPRGDGSIDYLHSVSASRWGGGRGTVVSPSQQQQRGVSVRTMTGNTVTTQNSDPSSGSVQFPNSSMTPSWAGVLDTFTTGRTKQRDAPGSDLLQSQMSQASFVSSRGGGGGARSHHGRVPSSPSLKLPPAYSAAGATGGASRGGTTSGNLHPRRGDVLDPSPMTLMEPAIATSHLGPKVSTPSGVGSMRIQREMAVLPIASPGGSVSLPVQVRARVVLPRSELIAVTCFAPSSPIPAATVVPAAAALRNKQQRHSGKFATSLSSLDFDQLLVAVGTKAGNLLILQCNGAANNTHRHIDDDLPLPREDITFGGSIVAKCLPPHLLLNSSNVKSSDGMNHNHQQQDSCTTIVWLRQQPFVMVGYRSGRLSWFRVSCTPPQGASSAHQQQQLMASKGAESSSSLFGEFSVEHLWTTTTSSIPSTTTSSASSGIVGVPVLSAEESTCGGVVIVTTRSDVLLLQVPRPSGPQQSTTAAGVVVHNRNFNWLQRASSMPESLQGSFLRPNMRSTESMESLDTANVFVTTPVSSTTQSAMSLFRQSAVVVNVGSVARLSTDDVLQNSTVVQKNGGDYVTCHPHLPYFAVLTRGAQKTASSGDIAGALGAGSTSPARLRGGGGGGATDSDATTTALYLQFYELRSDESSFSRRQEQPPRTFQNANASAAAARSTTSSGMQAVPIGPMRTIRERVRSDTILDASWAHTSSHTTSASPSVNNAAMRRELQLMINIADEPCVRVLTLSITTAAALTVDANVAVVVHQRSATAAVTNTSGLLFDAVNGGGPLTPTVTSKVFTTAPSPASSSNVSVCCKERIIPFVCPSPSSSANALPPPGVVIGGTTSTATTSSGVSFNNLIANVEWLSFGSSSDHHIKRAPRFAAGAGAASHIVGVGLHGELCITSVAQRTTTTYSCEDPRRLVVVAEGTTVSAFYDDDDVSNHTNEENGLGIVETEEDIAQRPPTIAEARAAVLCPTGDGRDQYATVERIMYVRAQAGFTTDTATALAAVTALEARSLGGPFVIHPSPSPALRAQVHDGPPPPTMALTILLRYLHALQTINVCRTIGSAPGILSWLANPPEHTPSVPLMAQAGLLSLCHVIEGSEAVCRCPSSLANIATTTAKGITSMRSTSAATGATTQQVFIIGPSASRGGGGGGGATSEPPMNDPRRLLLLEVLGWIPAPPPYATLLSLPSGKASQPSFSAGYFGDANSSSFYSSSSTTVTSAFGSTTTGLAASMPAFSLTSLSPKPAFRFHEGLSPWLSNKSSVERLVAQLLFYHRREEAASVLRVHHAIDDVFAPMSALLLTLPSPQTVVGGGGVDYPSSVAASTYGEINILDGLSDSIGELLASALLYATSSASTADDSHTTTSWGGGQRITGTDSPNVLLCDRIAMTILSNPDVDTALKELRACFLTSHCNFLLRLLFEGIDHNSVPIIQRYVDDTGDVQLASCLLARIGAVWHQQQPTLPTTQATHQTAAVVKGGQQQTSQQQIAATLSEADQRRNAATGWCWSSWMEAYSQFLSRRRLFVQRTILELYTKKKLLCKNVQDSLSSSLHATATASTATTQAALACVCGTPECFPSVEATIASRMKTTKKDTTVIQQNQQQHHIAPLGSLHKNWKHVDDAILHYSGRRSCSVCGESTRRSQVPLFPNAALTAKQQTRNQRGDDDGVGNGPASFRLDYDDPTHHRGNSANINNNRNQIVTRPRASSTSAAMTMSPDVTRTGDDAQSTSSSSLLILPGSGDDLPQQAATADLMMLQQQQQRQQQQLSRHGVDWMLTDAFVWCSGCGHGGHTTHLQEWFILHDQCPVGGCKCRCSAPAVS